MSKPRIWSTFMIRDELDMLRCQLIEHADTFHQFVIVEARVDHSGAAKPLFVREHWSEFAEWHDKITYIDAGEMPQWQAHWPREQGQRDVALPYLLGSIAPDDIVIVADVDEIPSRAAVEDFRHGLPEPVVGINCKLRFAAVDWHGSPGVNMVFAKGSVLLDGHRTVDTLRQIRGNISPYADECMCGHHWPEHLQGEPWTCMVCGNCSKYQCVEDARQAWHFSWFGGPENIRRKAVCSPHQETLDNNIAISHGYAWERGMGAPGPGIGSIMPITDDYPRFVTSRACPWYWWRPGTDGLPVDEQAKQAEVTARKLFPHHVGTCKEGHEVRMAGASAWHPSDGSPCPTAPWPPWEVRV